MKKYILFLILLSVLFASCSQAFFKETWDAILDSKTVKDMPDENSKREWIEIDRNQALEIWNRTQTLDNKEFTSVDVYHKENFNDKDRIYFSEDCFIDTYTNRYFDKIDCKNVYVVKFDTVECNLNDRSPKSVDENTSFYKASDDESYLKFIERSSNSVSIYKNGWLVQQNMPMEIYISY